MCDDCDNATNPSTSNVQNCDADKARIQNPSAKQFKALQTVNLNTFPDLMKLILYSLLAATPEVQLY